MTAVASQLVRRKLKGINSFIAFSNKLQIYFDWWSEILSNYHEPNTAHIAVRARQSPLLQTL